MSNSFSWRCEDCGAPAITREGNTFTLASAGTDAGPGKFRVACPVDSEHRGVVMEEARVAGHSVYVGEADS